MARMPRCKPLEIALVIGRREVFGRAVIQGIYRYARPLRPWRFEMLDPSAEGLAALARGGFDGAVVQLWSARILPPGLAGQALPIVNISGGSETSPFPRVTMDNVAVGRMAGEHLLSRGLRHFAFVGNGLHHFSRLRQEGFAAAIAQAGLAGAPEAIDFRQLTGEWLHALPKPVGVLGCSDSEALAVVEAAWFADIDVPRQVAVVGVDNDDVTCELSYPPLSSVTLPGAEVGRRAAELLDAMLHGRGVPKAPILLEPLEVVTRASTDVLAVEDEEVTLALEHIRDRPAGLKVSDVVEAVGVSRRTLEIRFRQALGSTIHREIDATRVNRARALLRETDLSVKQVARNCGFSSSARLSVVFRAHTGLSPTDWRKQTRAGGSNRTCPEHRAGKRDSR